MANSTQEMFRVKWTSLPRPVLMAVAVIFCVATATYALIWMIDTRRSVAHPVEIGFNQARDTRFDKNSESIPINNVTPGSPAERAGLQAGDEIIGLNGQVLTSYELFDKVWTRSHPGDGVDITVRRPGVAAPMTFHVIFRAAKWQNIPEGVARASLREILNFYPIFFVLVGFAVLFLRLEDGDAWLLAVLFASFVAAPSFNNYGALPAQLHRFVSLYRTVFFSLIGSLFYIFFALFPEKSPLERRAPWLKWVALVLGLRMLFPGLPYGDARLPGL